MKKVECRVIEKKILYNDYINRLNISALFEPFSAMSIINFVIKIHMNSQRLQQGVPPNFQI